MHPPRPDPILAPDLNVASQPSAFSASSWTVSAGAASWVSAAFPAAAIAFAVALPSPSAPLPAVFFHTIHTFPQIFCVGVIDTIPRWIYLPRQIEPEALRLTVRLRVREGLTADAPGERPEVETPRDSA